MEPVVDFRGAVCLLGRFPALAGVDLDVARGEIVLLQGPNGAGKTTVLRACAGLVPVVEGDASVLGVDLRADRRAVRHRVGLLGHASGLYEDLTVADNVRFWARAGRAHDADADAAMARLGLAGRLADVAVARLSAGQRRRTSLAVMVARRPELWLLDEPHAALDQDGRDLVDSLMADAVAAGATVLFASHELDRAQAVAHRTITIAGGTVAVDRSPAGTAAPGAPAPTGAEPAVEPDPEAVVS
ncbi:heme ABC exporter ATP-binding protein CcmA [Aquihabitans sp. G128]|uniref:heme ABC exporter ATP-binding protein CcmA n=1 Tax=Aquihabitans sp. G128 TaxID=2849779 RepID=UPI001C216129|nr:heme ABC exporter ATP-binding protein CcmA [Aquihabitans sp. G128]QXC60944.1 heme ABC exporter ATP-binding protein CcmA [Aquihabitans sp. G128]